MKLLEKYAKEMSQDEKALLTDLLSLLKSTDKEDLGFLVQQQCNAAKTMIYHYQVMETYEELCTVEEEKAIQLLHSLCQNTKNGCVLLGSFAIINKLEKPLFDYLMTQFDFMDYQKANKVQLSKYFKNKANSKHEQLERVHKMIKEIKNVFGQENPMKEYVISKPIKMIGFAMNMRYKEQCNQNPDFSTFLAIHHSEKDFNSIKRFLGLSEPRDIEQLKASYESKIKNVEIDQVCQEFKTNAFLVVEEVMDFEKSISYAFINSQRLGGALFKVDHINPEKKWQYRDPNYSNGAFDKVELTKDEYNNIKYEKGNIYVPVDRSYRALERSKNYRNLQLAETSANAFNYLKTWMREQDFTKPLGSLIMIESSNHSCKVKSYSMVSSIYWDKEKKEMMMQCLVADLLNETFGFEKYPMFNVQKTKLLDKVDASIFYQDAQHIAIKNKMK